MPAIKFRPFVACTNYLEENNKFIYLFSGGVTRSQEILVKQTSPQMSQKKAADGFPTTRIIFKQKTQLGEQDNSVKDQSNGRAAPIRTSYQQGGTKTTTSNPTQNTTSSSLKLV
jgi:hypothetical protein